jgi:hypothetical protein
MKNLYDLCTRHEASMESVTARKKDGIEAIKFMCKVQEKASIPQLLDDLRTQAGVQMVDVDVKGSQIGDT